MADPSVVPTLDRWPCLGERCEEIHVFFEPCGMLWLRNCQEGTILQLGENDDDGWLSLRSELRGLPFELPSIFNDSLELHHPGREHPGDEPEGEDKQVSP